MEYESTHEVADDEQNSNTEFNRHLLLNFLLLAPSLFFLPFEQIHNTLSTELKKPADPNSRSNASSRGKDEQQPDHHRGKIDTQGHVDAHEDDIVLSVVEDVVQAYGCEEDCEVDVEEVGAPGCGLMFGHAGHDWDVLLCVSRVEKGHRSA